MKIECFFSKGCESKKELEENLKKALNDEGIEAEISFREVSEEEARKLGIGGSPTIWINGEDIEPWIKPGGLT